MIIVFHLFNFLYTDDYSSTLACFIYVFFFLFCLYNTTSILKIDLYCFTE